MKELLLKIRALLQGLLSGGGSPLSAAAAVALALMEEGDLYGGDMALLPAGDVLQDAPKAGLCDPHLACGAAYALARAGRGGLVTALCADDERLDEACALSSGMLLPLVFLSPCAEADAEAIARRMTPMDMTCVPADGRDVMSLLPALRAALDKARDGDGPTLILCIRDRAPGDEVPADPLSRLDSTLTLQGYADPEELL